MSTSYYYDLPHEDSFRRFVMVSVFIHFVLIVSLTVKAFIFPDEALLYESAVKVDLVALPDKIQSLPEPAAPAPTEKTESPAPTPLPMKTIEKPKKLDIDRDAVKLEKGSKKEKAAFEKLKQLSALEEIERQEREEARQKAVERLNKIKGNALSSGSDLKGVSKLQHDNYLSSVEKHIRRQWSLPEWLSRKNLSAQVRVRFDEAGNVIGKEISKSSGNTTFDELVLQTVQNSSPVPAPPAKFVRILSIEGILLGFPE